LKADLHVHSHYSDGADSVGAVMQQAAMNGVRQLSFVDHDTTASLAEAQRLAKNYGLEVIPGIEISAYDFKRDRKVHILGYGYQLPATNIHQLCDPLLERRQAHSLWQIEQIRKAGFTLDRDAIQASAYPSQTIYKQHIMRNLTDAAYTSAAYQALYRQLFKDNGVAAGDIEYVNAFDAVEAIVADGGLAVVAHPGQLDTYALIPELVKHGLGGIESNHLDHAIADQQRVEELAQRHGLIMTGGTDYHGAFGASVEVGAICSPLTLG